MRAWTLMFVIPYYYATCFKVVRWAIGGRWSFVIPLFVPCAGCWIHNTEPNNYEYEWKREDYPSMDEDFVPTKAKEAGL